MALLGQLWKFRFVRFGVVGAICSLLQLIVLVVLAHHGVPDALANVAGITSGALLSYPLSKRFTWSDRTVNNHAIAWTTFMTIAVSAFMASELTFIAARQAAVPRVIASLLGICVGILVTWSGNNRLTFRRTRIAAVSAIEDDIAYPFNLSIVVPALNEALRIGHTLDELAAYLRGSYLDNVEVIVVAADGTDNTATIARTRAGLFPHFKLVQPGPKLGKGRDVREGVLASSGRYVMFMDADLATPLTHLSKVHAFMCNGGSVGIGVRNVGRYHNSRSRNFVSVVNSVLTRLVAVPGISDTRCGFKVFEARVAKDIFSRMLMLRWGFDTEILAIARHRGHKIDTFPIDDWHDPKENGSGLSGEPFVRTIIQSALDPIKVRLNLLAGHYQAPASRHAATETTTRGETLPRNRPNRTPWTVTAAAAVLSITASIIVTLHHAVLQYADANSYLLIARRTLDGTTPSLAQLGGSWLPLPDLLELSLAWNGDMYKTGLAGSVWSMAAYIVSVVLIYLIVSKLCNKKLPGLVAASVFGLSVYVLYLQSTPMTETLMFATILAAVYCFQQWIDTDQYGWLVGGGVAALLATITRYESWPITAALAASALFVAWRRQLPGLPPKLRRRRAIDRLVLITLLNFAGVLAWFAWCQIIFHDWLYFVNGAYAKPPVGNNPAVGNAWIATKTYAYAMIDTVGTPVLLLGVAGLVVFAVQVIRRRQSLARMLPTLTLLVVIPFYIVTIYAGQRPLDVMQLAGHNYNVRYGLLALLPASIFIGYLVWYLTTSLRKPTLKVASSLAVVGSVIAFSAISMQAGIGQLIGIEHASQATTQAASAFDKYYPGGLVLMQSWGNEALIKDAVPVSKLVDEGSRGLWKPALRSPIHNNITTIVIRDTGGVPDAVRSDVNAGELSHYKRVWTDGTYSIYVAKGKRILASGGTR